MLRRIPVAALLFVCALLAITTAFVLVAAFSSPQRVLTVSFLDVGQGDAIFIEGPTGVQVLVDGGKDRAVLRALPAVMGPLDRSIDVVVATHPDADHIGGLPDVFSLYTVSHLLLSGRGGESSIAQRFAHATEREKGLAYTIAQEGMRLHLGGGAYADILHPQDNVAQLRESNDASIIMRVVFGETAVMLTGDASAWVEERLVADYGDALASAVLKAGHHGSKTSSAATFLAAVQPETVVVSAAQDNSYGHPHASVLDTVQAAGAAILATADAGTITFVSDGVQIRQK